MTSLRDLYAQELGYRDFPSLKKKWDALPDSTAKWTEGLIYSHIQKLIDAIEKQRQQPRDSDA